MKKTLKRIAIVLAAWFFIHEMYITIDGLTDYKGAADLAVVLGNRVNADSTLSPVLQGRVDKGLQLYRQGRVKKIMVSGGKGEAAGKVPEGMAMKLYLESRGVPAIDIIEDNDGENTYLTGVDLKPVMDSLKYHSVIAVSSFYHITRCKYIFRKLGLSNVHGASSDTFHGNDWAVGLPREFPALYKYWWVYQASSAELPAGGNADRPRRRAHQSQRSRT